MAGVSKIHAFEAALLLFGMNVLFPTLVGLVFVPHLSLYDGQKTPNPFPAGWRLRWQRSITVLETGSSIPGNPEEMDEDSRA